jgi:hypothetical protein
MGSGANPRIGMPLYVLSEEVLISCQNSWLAVEYSRSPIPPLLVVCNYIGVFQGVDR